MVYSFFHPHGIAAAIALDAAGNVYVAGTVNPGIPQRYANLRHRRAMRKPWYSRSRPDGTKKICETALGGSVRADGTAIAVDSAGEVYVGGTTSSVDFPLVNPLAEHARRASAMEEQR